MSNPKISAPELIQPDRGQTAVALHTVTSSGFGAWRNSLTTGQGAAVTAQAFDGSVGQTAIVPGGPNDPDGWFAVTGVADIDVLSPWCLARLAEVLPEGCYRLAHGEPGAALHGWQTAQYRFDRYKQDETLAGPRILLTASIKAIDRAIAEARAENLVRDMVNTPAEDMGPAAIEALAEDMAHRHGAVIQVTKGDALEREYPMVHAVGRAAARHHAPRMIRIEWGRETDPKIAIVGKGVCFDSGGLDVKSAIGMKLMKKDMGGAAHALALADLVMGAQLPVRLHVLVPAVENAISSNAFRPGDVLQSRQGLTVEIGNTDAEGRLVLGDALTRATEDAPEFMIDFATLTGAARVALGPDYPALMCREDATAADLIAAGEPFGDTPWRLPLPEGYREWLNSDIADLNNAHGNPYAGASLAGLFLDRFVGEGIDWAHIDTFAWRPFPKPGRPKGGAAYGLRAAFHMLLARYPA